MSELPLKIISTAPYTNIHMSIIYATSIILRDITLAPMTATSAEGQA